MLFQTLHYAIFLILTVGLYWSAPYKYRLHILGIASLLFYGSWNWKYLPLLLLVSMLAWGLGRFVHRKKVNNWVYGFTIFILFIPLLIFKYWDWMGENIIAISSWLNMPVSISTRKELGIILPVGISFFTFQAISYLVDTRRHGKEENNPWRFFTFIAFFPQLIAGPIVRQHELLPQLRRPLLLAKGDIGEALFRIVKGLVKKLLFADFLYTSLRLEEIFSDPTVARSPELWLAIYAYTIWIYYDFSAYTDIAIGSAKLFGIKLPENFNRPYHTSSVAEFWRKWHITLSNWVRDYIYYPLGGARADTEWKIYRNIIITMVVIGIWHGASWNFVIYGILHGSAVSFNRIQRKFTQRRPGDPFDSKLSWFWRFLLTFHFVVLARILFGTDTLGIAYDYLIGLFQFDSETLKNFQNAFPLYYTPGHDFSNPENTFSILLQSYLPFALLLLGFAWHFTPKDWMESIQKSFLSLPAVAQAAIMVLAAALCWKFNNDTQLSFAYYQF